MTSTTSRALTANDFISLVAIGVNGEKKESINDRFNGLGEPITQNGTVDPSRPHLPLEALSAGMTGSIPVFPREEFDDAIANGDMAEAQKISSTFAAVVAQAQASGQSVSQQQTLLNAVCQYLEAIYGWSQQDGSHFVYKRSSFAMSDKELPNGSRLVSVTQQATFGAR